MNRSAIASSGLLDRIIAAKRAEVASQEAGRSRIRSEAYAVSGTPARFDHALTSGAGMALIAEVKRRSPSAGEILALADPAAVAAAYESAGASAVSVLTDREFFGGSLGDLEAVHATVSLPILRKDFTIDALQVHEARIAGAAAVLLIARILDDAQLHGLRREAENLGMSALVEVHNEEELERALSSGAHIIGVNSRDLDTLMIDLERAAALLALVPRACLAVAESGIRTVADATRMAHAGADAVLVGEALMKHGTGTVASSIASIPRTGR